MDLAVLVVNDKALHCNGQFTFWDHHKDCEELWNTKISPQDTLGADPFQARLVFMDYGYGFFETP
jgi:hypothetical protein